MQWLFYPFIFLFGLIIGSFLNCVVYRLEKEETLAGRSYCPHCKHTLQWLDLVPVLSWLWLGGKCRFCHQAISAQYPLVEIATGVLFLVMALVATSIVELIFLWYIAATLMVIFAYDFRHYLIPDAVLLPAIFIAVVYRLFPLASMLNYALAAAIAGGFFLIIFLVSRGAWMGFGDVKLVLLLGLLLGFPAIVTGLFLAFLFGAIIGVGSLLAGQKGMKSQMPFAPFLIVGTFVALVWGKQIMAAYLGILL